MRQRQLLSYENRKLGRIANFSVTTRVCKNKFVKAQGCDKYCYAGNMEKRWPTCFAKWDWNFRQSIKPNFVKKMTAELEFAGDIVRVHVAGDFYSQRYLNNWFEMARTYPHKIFYAYTKSMDLDFSKRPKNFKVLLSDDSLIFPNHHHKYDGVTCIKEKAGEKANKKEWFLCPTTCPTCKVCWKEESPRVMFKKH